MPVSVPMTAASERKATLRGDPDILRLGYASEAELRAVIRDEAIRAGRAEVGRSTPGGGQHGRLAAAPT